jgi:hypothetical protein
MLGEKVNHVAAADLAYDFNGTYVALSLSRDGRYVLFASTSADLVAGDTNNLSDVFVKDTQTGTIVRASVDANGGQLNQQWGYAALLSDDHSVIFDSAVGNLVPNDPAININTPHVSAGLLSARNGTDVFVKNLQTGAIRIVSTNANGVLGNDASYNASVSADGNVVAFESLANNLVANDSNFTSDIFVKNLITGAVVNASTSSDGMAANSYSTAGKLSADGRFVAFNTYADNLVAGDTNVQTDVFRKDLVTGELVRVSLHIDGRQSNDSSSVESISADGRYISFQTYDRGFYPGRSEAFSSVFVKDMQTGALLRVSENEFGGDGDGFSHGSTLSWDGRYVTFTSDATNLVSGLNHRGNLTYIKDLQSGAIACLSQDGDTTYPYPDGSGITLSADGGSAAFGTWMRFDTGLPQDYASRLFHTKIVLDNLAHYGNGGDDIVSGFGDFDVVRGGPGNDRYSGNSDFIVELPNQGNDTVEIWKSFSLPPNVENIEATPNVLNALIETGNELNNRLVGGSYADTLLGQAGNDILTGNEGNDLIDGGAGFDTAVYKGHRDYFSLQKTANGVTLTDNIYGQGTDTLSNIERIKFVDAGIAFDIDGNAGQAYRIYQAAFDRAPDKGGLGFWISTMDGGASLADVAGGFMQSAEFANLYGNNPANADLVTKFYNNVLHRAPDSGGYQYWLSALDQHVLTPAQVLGSFAESAENKAALVGVTANGIEYTLFGQ